MPTYTPLQSIKLTESAANVTFSNIPQSYTDIVVVCNLKTVSNDSLVLRFNQDSSSSYYRTSLGANGSTTQSTQGGATTTGIICTYGYSDSTNFNATSVVNINNYANSSIAKTILTKNYNAYNGNGSGISLVSTLWNKTSAINQITFQNDSSNSFSAGCTFDLYGVRAGSAKASGGTVRTDGTYWYHTFTSSGVFSSYQNMNVDYLVVAGGGGGGAGSGWGGGGGGAGGMRSTVTATGGGGSVESALAVTAADYQVLVGAGGIGGTYQNLAQSGGNSTFGPIISTGGGGGGAYSGTTAGLSGGSGGGGGANSAGGSGTANQGYAGGTAVGVTSGAYGGGGGGGAAAVGSNGTTGTGGNGGAGVASSISGTSVTYAGGGGGGAYTSGYPAGTGGSGIGGAGGNGAIGSNGSTNTGSGGGAGGGSYYYGGNGGSGIVIVRYAV